MTGFDMNDNTGLMKWAKMIKNEKLFGWKFK